MGKKFKLSGVSIFLLGFLSALYIFGFNTPLLPEFQIGYTLKGSLPDWITSVSTSLAVIVALVIAIWGENLKKMFHKPNLKLVDSIENLQEYVARGVVQGHTRLVFQNTGKSTAENVEVYVNKIFDNGVERENFIAVPLSWTHDGRSRRNFHPNQFGYLDFCRIDNMSDPSRKPILVLVAGAGVPTYQDFRSTSTEIELVIFQKSGQTDIYKLELDWTNKDAPVELQSFRKIK